MPNSRCSFLFQERSSVWKGKNNPTELELEPKVGAKDARDRVGGDSGCPPRAPQAQHSQGESRIPARSIAVVNLSYTVANSRDPKIGVGKSPRLQKGECLDSANYICTGTMGSTKNPSTTVVHASKQTVHAP